MSSLMMDDEVVLEDDDTKNKEQNASVEEELTHHPLVTFFKDHIIEHLVDELKKNPSNTHLDYQYADNQLILGKKRLACVNLMESLVELDEPSIREKILETEFYGILFDMFLTFKHNTFLQLHLDTIFHRILKDSNTSNNNKITFLQKLGIFEKLPEFWIDNQALIFQSQREFRYGYLAFTTRFANTLRDLSTSIPELEELTSKQSWVDFFKDDVEIYNEKNSINLANRTTTRKDSDDFDELDDKFGAMEERDDLDDDEGEDDNDDEGYGSNRKSHSETLQKYNPDKAREEHENDFLGETIEKDKDEDNLFSGLDSRAAGAGDDSDEDQIIGGSYEDSSDDDSENEKEDVSENSGYYDNNFWQVDQYSLQDLLLE
mmetsp:Transcript_7621/g.8677  ORF Transcript_7621/g.8677 Transcript_7621/m.8677 type:complete len:375 (-) Transcript_7621:177-1301(-)